jgi:hypothetical protein
MKQPVQPSGKNLRRTERRRRLSKTLQMNGLAEENKTIDATVADGKGKQLSSQ